MKEKELRRWFGISTIMTVINFIGFMILNYNIYSNLAGYTFGRSFQVFLGLIFSSVFCPFLLSLLEKHRRKRIQKNSVVKI